MVEGTPDSFYIKRNQSNTMKGKNLANLNLICLLKHRWSTLDVVVGYSFICCILLSSFSHVHLTESVVTQCSGLCPHAISLFKSCLICFSLLTL